MLARLSETAESTGDLSDEFRVISEPSNGSVSMREVLGGLSDHDQELAQA